MSIERINVVSLNKEKIMKAEQFVPVQCPYCGETFDLLVEYAVERQEYVEECPVCCKPFSLTVSVSAEGDLSVVTQGDAG